MTRRVLWLTGITLLTTLSGIGLRGADAPTAEPAAVARAKKTVQMLDNIYKQVVVLITEKYVHDEDDFPAGSAAVALFKGVSQTGSHEVRLLDATGQPYEAANVARDEFERDGIEQLKQGAKVVEKVVVRDGQNVLRAMTPVPVVMQKCVMCHEHYGDVQPGEPIGAISYIVPLE